MKTLLTLFAWFLASMFILSFILEEYPEKISGRFYRIGDTVYYIQLVESR